MSGALSRTAHGAAKWSFLTELIARTITPVTQLVLARLLAPEAFGIAATVVMVTSFAQIFSDSGFQNYLIQHDFEDDVALHRSANVAFWSSTVLASILLGVIATFRDDLAELVGNPGLGLPLLVASCTLPLTACVGTQLGLFRRSFAYKRLLPIRVGSAVVILVVSVTLAALGLDYWALIWGTLAGTLVNAVGLTAMSEWKPKLDYSFALFREMFAFSGWSLLEALSIWLTTWAGVFIVSNQLSPHELGLYRQPMTVINSLFALVVSATTPILFSALSRLQSDAAGFRRFFMRFQLAVATFVLPIGVGAFFYRHFLVTTLFGANWSGASLMFGVWGLSTGFMIVLSHYCSEIYRALGKPRISMFVQILYLVVMAPLTYLAAVDGFTTLVIVSAAIRAVAIMINQVTTYFVTGISLVQVLGNLRVPLLAVTVMGGVAAWLTSMSDEGWGWAVGGILACGVVYLGVCLCFTESRRLLLGALRTLPI